MWPTLQSDRVVGFGFYPKLLGRCWGPPIAIFHSLNVFWVVVLPGSGRDTSTLRAVVKMTYFSTILCILRVAGTSKCCFVLFCTQKWWDQNTYLCTLHTLCVRKVVGISKRFFMFFCTQRGWRRPLHPITAKAVQRTVRGVQRVVQRMVRRVQDGAKHEKVEWCKD